MKTKIIFFFTVMLAIISFSVKGQVTDHEQTLRKSNIDTAKGWIIGGFININLSQTTLKNWSAGGQNSLAINSILSVFANYKKKKSAWDNSLDIGYGLLQQGKDNDFMKTDDKVDFLSKYGRQAFNKHWYYAALLNFKTQMTPGYNYPNDSVKISDLMAPAYLITAVGMDYKPNAYLSAFISPITGKTIIVHNQELANAGAFGVEAATYDTAGNIITKGKTIRNEFGGYVRIIFTKNDFKKEWLKNVSFTTKIDAFSNYLDNPQNIDINWETLIGFKVNKYITVSFNTLVIYDDDITIEVDSNNDGIIDESGPRTQFKEILGVGFSYKF